MAAVDEMERASETLTVSQAYRAMISYLDARWEFQGKPGVLASILGDLSLDTWTDGMPADPASWSDWLQAIDRTN